MVIGIVGAGLIAETREFASSPWVWILLLPACVIANSWLRGKVELTNDELVAGAWPRPLRVRRDAILEVYEGKVPWGRARVRGVRIKTRDSDEGLPLSPMLGAERHTQWIDEIRSWVAQSNKSATATSPTT